MLLHHMVLLRLLKPKFFIIIEGFKAYLYVKIVQINLVNLF